MSANFTRPISTVRFTPDKFAKTDLFSGNRLFIGLNCFEPGQAQLSHTHAGAEKFYYIISGRARVTVGKESQEVEAGTLIWAPADVPHGVSEVFERTVMLVGIAPPPRAPTAAK
jgi:quercetin dioxygenase-like cupin family protein